MNTNSPIVSQDLAERKKKFVVLRNPTQDVERIQAEMALISDFMNDVQMASADLEIAREVLANPGLRRLVELPDEQWEQEIGALFQVENSLYDRFYELRSLKHGVKGGAA